MEKDVKEFSTATEKLIQVDIEKEMRESFLQYSMAVLVSRALPDVRDGMKPVHRRIIYTMNEADNTSSKPYRKCAYTVGEVLGKYHPHGDASVYDALVRLAQDFSMRYPLIDGHGNFGSVDGDPPRHLGRRSDRTCRWRFRSPAQHRRRSDVSREMGVSYGRSAKGARGCGSGYRRAGCRPSRGHCARRHRRERAVLFRGMRGF